VRDEARAREVIADVFTVTFARHANADDEEFRIWLFAEARHALRSQGFVPEADGLNGRERDVVSLLFDAQLTRREVAMLLSISEDNVAATLLKALRKLREATTPKSVPFLLRTT
jgi:DNA-binding CsgD family transcriptional regulator